jgi:hypothetical protein
MPKVRFLLALFEIFVAWNRRPANIRSQPSCHFLEWLNSLGTRSELSASQGTEMWLGMNGLDTGRGLYTKWEIHPLVFW